MTGIMSIEKKCVASVFGLDSVPVNTKRLPNFVFVLKKKVRFLFLNAILLYLQFKEHAS